MSEDSEVDEMMKRIRAAARVTSSRSNMHGMDPDNPYEVRGHERESLEFDRERSTLKAKVLYVHGFASSGNSGTARKIQKYLPGCRVISPDLPVDPDEALALLRRIVVDEKVDVVVGTSMGGMFAQKPKVLLNPSFHVSESMRRKIGVVPFFKAREDGATEFVVTPSLCDAFRDIETGQFDNLTVRLL